MHRAIDRTAADQSDAFRLVCACSAWPLSGAGGARIRALAEKIADWDCVWAVAKRQRVVGLVYHALCNAQVAVPQAVLNAFASDTQRIARQNLQITAEVLRLQDIFDRANIPAIFVKGVGLAQLAYRTLGVKQGKDIDLLVGEDRVEDALNLLDVHGYTLCAPAANLNDAQRRAIVRHCIEFGLEHRQSRVQVELHWRLTPNRQLLSGIDVDSPTQDIALGTGHAIRTLAPDDLFAYLCAHGAVHAWSRLKWLADVSALIDGASDEQIERLYRHAAARGAGYCAAEALVLRRDLLGLPLPQTLQAEFGRDRKITWLVARAKNAMSGPAAATELEDRPAAKIGVLLRPFFLGRGMRFFFGQLRASAVGASDIVLVPLPERLHFLYLPLRPFLWPWRRWRYLLGRTGWDRPRARRPSS